MQIHSRCFRVTPPWSPYLLTLFSKQDHVTSFVYKNPDRLSVIDPNNAANDISGGSRNFFLICDCFASARHVLQSRMDEIGKLQPQNRERLSILESIIGADYSSFSRQRAELRRYHSRGIGKCDDAFVETPPEG